jgi:hypothetical protein
MSLHILSSLIDFKLSEISSSNKMAVSLSLSSYKHLNTHELTTGVILSDRPGWRSLKSSKFVYSYIGIVFSCLFFVNLALRLDLRKLIANYSRLSRLTS